MLKLIVFFLLISTFGIAQNINNGIDFSDSKNLILLQNINNRNNFFGVNNAVINQPKKFYRFWNTSYCIEVTESENNINGRVIFAVENLNKKSDYYRKIFPLTQQQTEKIFEIIKIYDLETLPTDNKISGWLRGFDGNLFEIESNINNIYTYKSYWTPTVQNNVPEAKKIISLTDNLNEIINIIDLKKQYDTENKFLSYRPYGVSYSVLKILTKKEVRKQKRIERKNKKS